MIYISLSLSLSHNQGFHHTDNPLPLPSGLLRNNCNRCIHHLTAKWGKESLLFEELDGLMTIGEFKTIIRERTGILQNKMKLIGVSVTTTTTTTTTTTAAGPPNLDASLLKDIKVKNDPLPLPSGLLRNNCNRCIHHLTSRCKPRHEVPV